MPAPKPRLIVGLTGPIGSGVSSVSRVLESMGFYRLSLSEPIKKAIRERENLAADDPLNPKQWRQQLQDLGDEGRRSSLTHWLDVAWANVPDADQPVVIDAIRNPGEVAALRDTHTRFFLVAVVAHPDVRWARSKQEYADDYQAFARDNARDSEDKDDKPHGQQVGRCVGEADYVLLNDVSHPAKDTRSASLRGQLDGDVDLMQGKAGRPPFDHETHMAEAYTLSLRSRCLKRYVGAVIVGRDGLPLSSGFNENPVGMQPCVLQYKGCFKDDVMHGELEGLAKVYCPACGTPNTKLSRPWVCSNKECRENLKVRLYPSRNMEKCTAIHAEERAVRSLAGRSAEGATMYVTTYPCLQCSRYIVDEGVKTVFYVEAYPVREAAEFLKLNGVDVKPFSGFKARAFTKIFKPVS